MSLWTFFFISLQSSRKQIFIITFSSWHGQTNDFFFLETETENMGKLLIHKITSDSIMQMILSFELPFALIPLLKFTSSKTKMGIYANSTMVWFYFDQGYYATISVLDWCKFATLKLVLLLPVKIISPKSSIWLNANHRPGIWLVK